MSTSIQAYVAKQAEVTQAESRLRVLQEEADRLLSRAIYDSGYLSSHAWVAERRGSDVDFVMQGRAVHDGDLGSITKVLLGKAFPHSSVYLYSPDGTTTSNVSLYCDDGDWSISGGWSFQEAKVFASEHGLSVDWRPLVVLVEEARHKLSAAQAELEYVEKYFQ